MLNSTYNKIAGILLNNDFSALYALIYNKHENHLDKRFAIVKIISEKPVGKGISNENKIFEEIEIEIKISLYFKPNEDMYSVEAALDTLMQSFYKDTGLNITNIFFTAAHSSNVYKCLVSEMVLKLSYLIEETT